MPPSVGFAGLGHMGLPMADRLADALVGRGITLTVWNWTGARAGPLAARGVPVAGSLLELAAASDVLITMPPGTAWTSWTPASSAQPPKHTC